MKVYEIELSWLFKGRYEKEECHRVSASNIRAAVGKALAGKKDGYRESPGAVMRIKSTVLITNNEGGR